jgi:ribosome biogenesis GTPase
MLSCGAARFRSPPDCWYAARVTAGHDALRRFGWSPYFEDQWNSAPRDGQEPARIAVEHRGAYELYSARGELWGELSGRLRHELESGTADAPAAGDWVAVEGDGAGAGEARIRSVLARKTKISRRAAGRATVEQVVAANVDYVFVLTAMGRDVNARRIERYLTVVWESGASPVIVLTKSDLAEDVESVRAELGPVAMGVPVHAISTLAGAGLEQLSEYLQPAVTVALIGSSGVGKSTLLNHWLGEARLDTREVREDGKGKHTTTRRELHVIGSGALVLDTPGMRELALWEAEDGLDAAFAEIEVLAEECKFRDCTHAGEPDCAVRAAVEAGTLEAERWDSYQKLARELDRTALETDALGKAQAKAKVKVMHRALNQRLKQKYGARD